MLNLKTLLVMKRPGRGFLLPVPRGEDDDELRKSVKTLKGGTGLVETTSAGFGEGRYALMAGPSGVRERQMTWSICASTVLTRHPARD